MIAFLSVPHHNVHAPRIPPQVFFDLDEKKLSTAHYLSRVAAGATDGVHGLPSPPPALSAGTSVCAAFATIISAICGARVGAYGGGRLRAVTHCQIGDADVEALLAGATTAAALLSPVVA